MGTDRLCEGCLRGKSDCACDLLDEVAKLRDERGHLVALLDMAHELLSGFYALQEKTPGPYRVQGFLRSWENFKKGLL